MGDDDEQILGDDEVPELTEERFAANLRAVREASGMSQGRLADEMAARGWPWRQQTVTRVETGRRMVRLGEAQAVAEILETSLDRLTWPTGEARVVELLAEWMRIAKTAYTTIAEQTSELLRTTALLRGHPAVTDTDPAAARQLLNAVMEARKVRRLTPEGAVAQGVARIAESGTPHAQRSMDHLPVFRPRLIADADSIADSLRRGELVIVDLCDAPEGDARRIQDYVNGAARVRGGSVHAIGDSRYLVLPATVDTRERAISTNPGTHARLVSTPGEGYVKPSPAQQAYYSALGDVSEDLFGHRGRSENRAEIEQVIAEAAKRGILPPDEHGTGSGGESSPPPGWVYGVAPGEGEA
jgi:FtsZ-interacting cell division protein YlmF